jgi:hypothetical protein
VKEEDKGFLDKPREFRDRSKKKRPTVDERREQANDLRPKHEPYHRRKDWTQLPYEEGPANDFYTGWDPAEDEWYEEGPCPNHDDEEIP